MTVLQHRPGAGSTSESQPHQWQVESHHATSDGTVVYVRCARCGARRVELQVSPRLPSLAISREVAERR